MTEILSNAEFLEQATELAGQIGKLSSGKRTAIVAGALVILVTDLLIKHPPGLRRYGAQRFHDWLLEALKTNNYLPEGDDARDAARALLVGALELVIAIKGHGVPVRLGEFPIDDDFAERLHAVIKENDEVSNLISELMAVDADDDLETSGASDDE